MAVVCWSTVTEDVAARTWAVGFFAAYSRLALQDAKPNPTTPSSNPDPEPNPNPNPDPNPDPNPNPNPNPNQDGKPVRGGEARVLVRHAFDAGCAAFLGAGFRFGDPLAYLHPPGHPHRAPRGWVAGCEACAPPVQGRVVLLHGAEDGGGSVVETWGTNDPVGGCAPSGSAAHVYRCLRGGGHQE